MSNETGMPSREQVAEGIAAIGHGVPATYGWCLQQWITHPMTSMLIRYILNCTPTIINKLINAMEISNLDIAQFKADILHLDRSRVPNEISDSHNGYSYKNTTLFDSAGALKKFNVKIIIHEFFSQKKAESWPLQKKFTNYTWNNYSAAFEHITLENYKQGSREIATCEEILDLILDITIRAILKNCSPMDLLREYLYPHNNKPFTIICQNQVIESSEESRRPIIIIIYPVLNKITINPWPIKYFHAGKYIPDELLNKNIISMHEI